MSGTVPGGLRERKRRATREAIERGALELALEHGYENVTVEMICERATISPRTFFNYAGSKERAVLGIEPPLPGEELREAYIAGRGDTPMYDLLAILAEAVSEASGSDPQLLRKRHEVIRDNPALAAGEFARLEEAEHSIVELVRSRLLADAPQRQEDPELEDEARMAVSLAFGLVHFVIRDWMVDGFPADAGEILRKAAGLARRVSA